MVLESVWETGRPPSPPPTPVEGHHDVVVVGGGLTGLTTALLLARAGRSVLLVEARRLGAGTTGGSTAKVSVLQGTRLQQIAAKHGTGIVRDYIAANRAGRSWLEAFCGDHDVAVQHRTAWTYATGEQGRRLVEREHEAAVTGGLETVLEPEAPLPFPTTGAVSLAGQLQLDPIELVDALAREAERAGARLAEGTRVRRIRGTGATEVVTETGTATADTVVVATNLPMLDRGAHFARLKPERSYGLAYRGAEDVPVDGMFLSADTPTRSLRDAVVRGERLLLAGGEGHVTGRTPSARDRLDALRSWVERHFAGLTETHAWSAQDYRPAHELPLAGAMLPGADHLLFAGGYAKWGLTNGVAAALTLSGQVVGERPEWSGAMAAWTARELAGAATTARFNAEVGLEMGRGWLAPLLRKGREPRDGEGLVRTDGLRPPVAHSRVDGIDRRVSAVCTHLGGILRWNDAEASWDCPLHGSRFDAAGQVLEGPATCPLASR